MVLTAVSGITDDQAMQMAKGLAVTGDLKAAAQQIKNLYKLFAQSDCTMVEVCKQTSFVYLNSYSSSKNL